MTVDRDESGNASIVLVAAIAALLLVLGVVLAYLHVGLERQRAQSALDLAALAGAHELNNGVDDPCQRAKEVLAANTAKIAKITCVSIGTDVHVDAEVSSIRQTKKLVSVAGPANNW